jgi:hypothetical protein
LNRAAHDSTRPSVFAVLILATVPAAAWAEGVAELRSVAAPADAAPSAALCLEDLTRMSWPDLEKLYRGAEAGPIPEGYLRGRAVYCPCDRHAGVRAAATRTLWHGKAFDGHSGTLVNQWLGVRAIRARVCYGPSWLDGETSIVMDYGGTSRIWADVRDEAREVAPGLYLGRMYRRTPSGPQFQFFFALEAGPR